MNQKGKQILDYLSKPEILDDFRRVQELACYSDGDMLDFSRESKLYQCYVHSQEQHPPIFDGPDEKLYQTGLREVIGFLRRCDRKESLRQYCRANSKRLSHLDEDTYITAGMILGEPLLLIQKKHYEKEGSYDMCQAMKDLLAEAEKRGEMRGVKLGESNGRKEMKKELVQTLYRKGKSLEEISQDLDIPKKDVLMDLYHLMK